MLVVPDLRPLRLELVRHLAAVSGTDDRPLAPWITFEAGGYSGDTSLLVLQQSSVKEWRKVLQWYVLVVLILSVQFGAVIWANLGHKMQLGEF